MEPCRTSQMLHLVSHRDQFWDIYSSCCTLTTSTKTFNRVFAYLQMIALYIARFVANDHRRTTSPTTLVQTLNWQTLERRRTIKQAMTFYTILNNIIEINPPTGLLTRSHNRHHFTIPRSRLNSVVYSFYPRAMRIWNTIPKEITEIKQPESFHAAISKLPFTTPTHLKCL